MIAPIDYAELERVAKAAGNRKWEAEPCVGWPDCVDVRDPEWPSTDSHPEPGRVVADRTHAEYATFIAAWSPATAIAMLADRHAMSERVNALEDQLRPGSLTERSPTVFAYEPACAALEKHRQRASRPHVEPCSLTIGQRVTVSQSAKYAADWPGEYVVVGLTWEYQRGDGRINVAIASEDEIAQRYGSTDGWHVEDLLLAPKEG